MGCPSNVISPSSGFVLPAKQRISVVLPAPLGPRNASRSPTPSENETPCNACSPPYDFSQVTNFECGWGGLGHRKLLKRYRSSCGKYTTAELTGT